MSIWNDNLLPIFIYCVQKSFIKEGRGHYCEIQEKTFLLDEITNVQEAI